MDEVSFLVAGVQKGGTTALFRYLRKHPELQLAQCKEVHFFDNDRQNWLQPDYGFYHAHFDQALARRWGEVTPIYIYWPESLERIAQYNPGMRLILSFRDPALRAWSQWVMESGRDSESEPFSWCIREGRQRVAGDKRTPGFHRVYSYIERGYYGSQLRRALALFPREQILCLRSEDLKHDPRSTLDKVCAFLDVAPFDHVHALEANVGGRRDERPSAEDMHYMAGLFADEMRLFAELSGLDVSGWTGSPSALPKA